LDRLKMNENLFKHFFRNEIANKTNIARKDIYSLEEYNKSQISKNINNFSIGYKGKINNNNSSIPLIATNSKEASKLIEKETFKIINKNIKVSPPPMDKSWICHTGKTINNLSSANYNIINHESDYISKKKDVGLTNKRILNRQKSMSEFIDLVSPNYHRLDKSLEERLNKNPNIFKKQTGVFSNMYDISIRNGSISIPFEKAHPNIKK
jgi:hypothetical protein